MARLIDGLAVLRGEFNIVNPHRDATSDGWIGDDRHAQTASDHNPDKAGIVHAIDVDKDGVPMAKIVAYLIGRCKAGKESRLQYVIYRRTIWSRSWGWGARKYLGVNPHLKHAHFSARYSDVASNSRSWGVATQFGPGRPAAPPPAPPKPGKPVAHPPGSRELAARKPPLSGADVVYVQKWIGKVRCGAPDGVYNPTTVAGVRWYQRVRGLTPDGMVGPATWRNMGVKWTGPA